MSDEHVSLFGLKLVIFIFPSTIQVSFNMSKQEIDCASYCTSVTQSCKIYKFLSPEKDTLKENLTRQM